MSNSDGNDMGHMAYLEAVSAADVDHLRQKEATYRGSWKRRGGVGAYMMMARKIDRLENMAQEKTPVYGPGPDKIMLMTTQFDIFAMIENKPDGSDGTALAEVRDLRRYLLLVEAEMASRGVVTGYERARPTVEELEEILREPDAQVEVRPDGSVRAVVDSLVPSTAPKTWIDDKMQVTERVPDALDKITLLIDNIVEKDLHFLTHIVHHTLRERIIELAHLVHHPEEVEVMIKHAANDGCGDGPLTTQRVFKTKEQLVARLLELDKKIIEYPQWGAVLSEMSEERCSVLATLYARHGVCETDLAALRFPSASPGTPEDGGHHARYDAEMSPLQTDHVALTDHPPDQNCVVERRVPRFAPDELEPRDGLTEPPRLWSYVTSRDPVSGVAYFNVDRHCAEMPRPTLLQREMNDKEYELSEPRYRGMYEYSTRGEGKYVLRTEFLEHWGRRS